MTPDLDLNEPADTATERPPPGPIGTWTIDHTHSSVVLTWGKPQLGTVTGRLHCLGVVHVAVLPPVGMIRFDRPAVLPVLTMALDPASVDTGDAHLDTTLRGPGAFDVTRHHWWTLRSESLELLPTGTWRIMATLTARGTTALVELRVEVEASDPDWLVLRGRGVLDRRAFGIGNRPALRNPRVRVDLELHARRVTRSAPPAPESQSGRVKKSATSSGPLVGSSSGS